MLNSLQINRLNKLLFLAGCLFIINIYVFAETSGQNRDLKDLEKFDPESIIKKENAEIVPPEILNNSSEKSILKDPPVTGDKNIVIPDDQLDSEILKSPSDNDFKEKLPNTGRIHK
ncbi:MAG: hypothetical protein U1D41_12915 [Nitrosomonas sp.]|uniref:hypothetical protein n=1 Tax=Nitrosomonas sp. TaxID=42353 RepID=UPI002732D8B0|nr:hypothetical protein [Nitrosomonas sp.]MDP3663739.1 hypothetical protein [Nitrosomonas sp.]MDZ4107030.1 hypothetical protein [Nitrosomonas sp.]